MNPKLFDFTLRRWKWHHLPEDIAAKLSEHASADELVCVKLTDTRAVYKFEDLYIKVSHKPLYIGNFAVREYTDLFILRNINHFRC